MKSKTDAKTVLHFVGAGLFSLSLIAVSIFIMTLIHVGFMILGGSLLGVGIATFNNTLIQIYTMRCKSGKFAWRSYFLSSAIGGVTGLITTIFSTIRVYIT